MLFSRYSTFLKRIFNLDANEKLYFNLLFFNPRLSPLLSTKDFSTNLSCTTNITNIFIFRIKRCFHGILYVCVCKEKRKES